MKHGLPKDLLEPELRQWVEKAEEQDGYRYGAAMYWPQDGQAQPCFVDVLFYPKRRWWLCLLDQNARIELTRDIYRRVKPLTVG